MKFLRLEILNLASLDRAGGETINFEKGALGDSTIFSIVGPTGSGKSTILDAICLALYNRAPRYPRKKGDRNQNIEIYGELEDGEKNRLAPTDSRNILTRGKKEGYSKLTFLANNGNIYRAEWYVRQKTKNYDDALTSLYVISTKGDKTIEEAAEWDKLPQIIGLDYDQFLRTVLIAQGAFANFLTAKENERYELLEKLIGCEEMYTNIATKIKQQKDDAVKAFDLIISDLSAQEKDVIPEEELLELRKRIEELAAEEKKNKEEIEKLTLDLGWYTTEEKLVENITKYEQEFSKAKDEIAAVKEEFSRLVLHDTTLQAVSYYKDIKTSEDKIDEFDKLLKNLSEKIKGKTSFISNEEQELESLKFKVQKASEILDDQKPHINRAREILVELNAARNTVKEKEQAHADAEAAKNKAYREVKENSDTIQQAEKNLKTAQDHLQKLNNDINDHSNILKEKVKKSIEMFSVENEKLKGHDAEKLQEAKSSAEKIQTDLKTAIRIQGELKSKSTQIKQHTEIQENLTSRNKSINEELGKLNIEVLKQELDTIKKSYTLMTSENWMLHRRDLADGEPCPLCGATHHPYQTTEVLAPVIEDMSKLIDEKETELKKMAKNQNELIQESSKNTGMLDGIQKALRNLKEEVFLLNAEWRSIHEAYGDWPADEVLLRKMQSEIDKKAEGASDNLTQYNQLVRRVEQLRKEKEQAEKEEREYTEQSNKQKKEAETKVADAQTILATEKGKTENLKTQQSEKSESLTRAADALQKAKEKVTERTNALKAEIGDKVPDAYEKQLTKAKEDAEKEVDTKNRSIGKKREELTELQGKESTMKEQEKIEYNKFQKTQNTLTTWLENYNKKEEHLQALTVDDIVLLYNANDNWEEMRAKHKRLNEAFTITDTKLKNEIEEHEKHLESKPKLTKDELVARKAELDQKSNDELVNSKARFQRHETAKNKMGSLFEKKKEAELLKKEWEQISDAIGGDGKTLRKIAQCYTLRFLIEHANVEIRKFNSRYELQQVKNSLGIRIIDHDRADDVRDTTSLSGGETFIVSLGLALGLSALSSRNISFENLFIDEGFGTLDPDTLAIVIDSLAMLQSSQGKKVGVISHTDTMFERITTQIRVIKNGHSGSSHIEIYPN